MTLHASDLRAAPTASSAAPRSRRSSQGRGEHPGALPREARSLQPEGRWSRASSCRISLAPKDAGGAAKRARSEAEARGRPRARSGCRCVRLVQIRGPSRSRRRVRARDAGPAGPPAVPRRERQRPSGPGPPGDPKAPGGCTSRGGPARSNPGGLSRANRTGEPDGARAQPTPRPPPKARSQGPCVRPTEVGRELEGRRDTRASPPKGQRRWPVSSVRRRRPDPRPKPWAWDALLSFASPSAYRAAESHLWRVCLTRLVASSGFFDLSTLCSLCDRPGLSHPGAAPGVFTLQRFSPAGSRTPFGSSCPS